MESPLLGESLALQDGRKWTLEITSFHWVAKEIVIIFSGRDRIRIHCVL